MVGTKGLFIVAIVSIVWVLVSLVALILVSGWLQLVIVLSNGGVSASSLLLAGGLSFP
jgi:hypothetical protein